MIQNIKTYAGNIVALEIIGGVTEADVAEFERQFAEKLAAGHTEVNVIVALDKLDTKKSSIKAALRERVWGVKNLNYMANVAIVANKRPFNWLKKAILLEAWLLMRANPNAHEKYYDIKDLDKALAFVESREVVLP